MNSSRSLLQVDAEVSGFLESTRWLPKPPRLLVTQVKLGVGEVE
jgi:hypothetical protein